MKDIDEKHVSGEPEEFEDKSEVQKKKDFTPEELLAHNKKLIALNKKYITENEELNIKIEEHKKKDIYLMAEMENVRKIARKDIEDAKNYAVFNFATEMLQVLETLDRAISSITTSEQETDSVYTGITLTKKAMLNAFLRNGITKIEAEGKKFDHRFHHAVKTISDPEKENNLVVEVLQEGYMIKDRVLRAAMVVITSN